MSKCRPLASIGGAEEGRGDRVPSLESLACQQHELFLQAKAAAIGASHGLRLQQLRCREKEQVGQVNERQHKVLVECQEADVAHRLHSLLRKAECKLQDRCSKLLKCAETERNDIVNTVASERDSINMECAKEHQKVFDDC